MRSLKSTTAKRRGKVIDKRLCRQTRKLAELSVWELDRVVQVLFLTLLSSDSMKSEDRVIPCQITQFLNCLCSTDSDFDESGWKCYYANIMNPQKFQMIVSIPSWLMAVWMWWGISGFCDARRKIALFTYFDFKYLKNYVCQEAKIFRIYSVLRADSENLYFRLIGS